MYVPFKMGPSSHFLTFFRRQALCASTLHRSMYDVSQFDTF